MILALLKCLIGKWGHCSEILLKPKHFKLVIPDVQIIPIELEGFISKFSRTVKLLQVDRFSHLLNQEQNFLLILPETRINFMLAGAGNMTANRAFCHMTVTCSLSQPSGLIEVRTGFDRPRRWESCDLRNRCAVIFRGDRALLVDTNTFAFATIV